MPPAEIIVVVLFLNLVVFVGGRIATMESNHLEIAQALRAAHDAPSAETRARVDAAFATATASRARLRSIVNATMLTITVGGVAAASWQFLRERRQYAALERPASDANT